MKCNSTFLEWQCFWNTSQLHLDVYVCRSTDRTTDSSQPVTEGCKISYLLSSHYLSFVNASSSLNNHKWKDFKTWWLIVISLDTLNYECIIVWEVCQENQCEVCTVISAVYKMAKSQRQSMYTGTRYNIHIWAVNSDNTPCYPAKKSKNCVVRKIKKCCN